ncbi:hypothetical protein K1719_046863 [Acacia pycnantha]|nr:hypothetical protein K1719_046863 [Acacia pycnantha]
MKPPSGSGQRYLVLQDEEAETYGFFGLWKKGIGNLPFPQNRNLTVEYTVSTGTSAVVYQDPVLFIPVLNQPLSSNRYYVVSRKGKHQGEASTCSKEDDMGTCLCCNYVKDVKSRPLNPFDEYQQFEIKKKRWGFQGRPILSDGFPPQFLRNDGWGLSTKTPRDYQLGEALGINPTLRSKLPPFTFSSSSGRSSEPVVIGKWYCPFMFVKEEGVSVKDQMKRSVFYEMTLERRWEKFYSKENNGKSNEVFVDVVVKTEVAKLDNGEAVWEEGKVGGEGVMWFRNLERGVIKIGLSMAIVERMRWEEERSDYREGNNEKKEVRFEKWRSLRNEWNVE